MSRQERVRDAAILMDKEIPGWHNLINIETLKMSDCNKCVLGQVFGAEMEHKLVEILGEKCPPFENQPFLKGLDYMYRAGYVQAGYVQDGVYGTASDLRCMWIEEITTRRAKEKVHHD